ncbi:hypothetical protein [Microbacterium murale]|uniref:Uncharacterized protein n=1 Tax=Microbacterium murale TaxID=1081040 RepID=A0ABU0PE81_9MICO|nr:hypothetical protein [Microbacterium murale]MDQ0645628.1 hypothetical protein [Microbacterium murale]
MGVALIEHLKFFARLRPARPCVTSPPADNATLQYAVITAGASDPVRPTLVLTDWSVDMSPMPDPRFELKKITDTEWLVLDHRYVASDARRTVACIYQLEQTDVEVVWLRDLPLAERYTGAFDVLEDVERFYTRHRWQRPVLIPHMPPMAATA